MPLVARNVAELPGFGKVSMYNTFYLSMSAGTLSFVANYECKDVQLKNISMLSRSKCCSSDIDRSAWPFEGTLHRA